MAKTASNTTNGEETMVVVVTQGNAIFCGWTTEPDSEVVKLRAARQAVYYSADTHGLLGLAANGPGKDSRIGPPANITVRNITHVIECSPQAVKAWGEAEWKR
jgi:hypothetical protein